MGCPMVPVYACARDVSAAIGWKVGNGKLVLGLTMDAAEDEKCLSPYVSRREQTLL